MLLPEVIHDVTLPTTVVVDVVAAVLVVHLDLEYRQVVHPGNKPGERGLAGSGHSYEPEVSLGPAEAPVNPEHVVQHLVEQHERHVQLLLVEHLEPGLGVVPVEPGLDVGAGVDGLVDGLVEDDGLVEELAADVDEGLLGLDGPRGDRRNRAAAADVVDRRRCRGGMARLRRRDRGR